MRATAMNLLLVAAILGVAAAQVAHPVLHCKDQDIILQVGSSTAFPISREHASRYANPAVTPLAYPAGSTLGFTNFLGGASDVATSSRMITPQDYADADCDPANVVDGVAQESCQGRLPVGVKVANDRIVLIVSQSTTWIPEEGITFDQVLQLFNVQDPPSWADVFPDGIVDEATLGIPDAQSGTLTFFAEQTGLNFTGARAFSSFGSIRSYVGGHPWSIGIIPYSSAVGASFVRSLPVDGVDPLDPNSEGYAFERPLMKYYDAAPGADNAATLDFLCALLDVSGQNIIRVVGHLPLPEAERAAEFEKLGCESRNVVNKLEELTGVMQQASFCRDSTKIPVIGSSTVFPVIEEAGRVFPNPLIQIVARAAGSTTGIRDLLSGSTELAMMSRPLAESDYTVFSCDAEAIVDNVALRDCKGVLPVGVQLGTDMLAIIAHPDSELSDLSLDDVGAIFVEQSTGNTLYVPDANSGTRDYFESTVGPVDAQGWANDNAIIDGVASDANGIGLVGAAYATDPRVKVLSVEGISPLDNSADYAMARPLFLYYDASADHFHKAANEFMCWMLKTSGGQQVLENVGYVPLEESVRASESEALQCLESSASK